MYTSFTPPVATGKQFIPTLPEHNGAIDLSVGLLCRLHDLGPSSNRHARFVLFDQVTFLQVLKKFPHIFLSKVPAHVKLPADLIDNS